MNIWLKTALSFVPWFLFIAIYVYYPFPDEVAQFFAILPMACFAAWLQFVICIKLGRKLPVNN
jgi:branched-subunit amino acid transport protein